MRAERDFQRFALAEWEKAGYWGENVHPSSGMKSGIPDTLFMVGDCLLPIEMKIGTVVDCRLLVEDIRPSQRRWHLKYYNAGGTSRILVGVPKPTGWEIYEIDLNQFISGAQRFDLGEVAKHESIVEAIKRKCERLVLQIPGMDQAA